jgi:hypothetical protein
MLGRRLLTAASSMIVRSSATRAAIQGASWSSALLYSTNRAKLSLRATALECAANRRCGSIVLKKAVARLGPQWA